ncbi:protein translocase subunit SecF [Patescibacteria group bacterium]|nr:protein translocase subunit SecF [Patescibacteria group bacterium]
MKFRPLFYIFSLFLLTLSLFSILKWGFHPSIDFVGGSVWELELPSDPSPEEIKQIFSNQNIDSPQISVSSSRFLLKFPPIDNLQKETLSSDLLALDPNLQELKFDSLGPSLGRELLKKTIYAIILSSLALFLFIGSRFKDRAFGLSAILAMFHDTFILIGSFSLLGHFWNAQLDALFITAVLTTLSASVHDTVVTFDRIRELRFKNIKVDWVNLANQAVGETLVRSINNSMTIIFMLLSLAVLGGETTRWFAIALLIGAVLGTYSSLAVAVPLLLLFKKKQKT